jgi:exonuclease SbcD
VGTRFTFLHTADIHLDSPMHRLDRYEGAPAGRFRHATRRAFENLVELAIDQEVAFVLISGDLYDGDWQDYNTGLYLVRQMARLREAGIAVCLLYGNHDAESRISRRLKLPDNVHRFPSQAPATVKLDHCGAAVHGQSFATPAETRNLARSYPPAAGGYFNIGMLHTALSGREGHEPYAPCSLEDLMTRGYDYWALGHVHRREMVAADPPVVFCGNLQGRHIRETGARGCMQITVSDNAAPDCRFVPLDVVRWESVGIDATDAENGYAVVDRAREAMQHLLAQNDNRPTAVRLTLRGRTAAHDSLLADSGRWLNEIRSAALDSGADRIWVEKVQLDTTAPDTAGKTRSSGAVSVLLELMEELERDPENGVSLATELQDLERKLPAELTTGLEAVRPADPAWVASLLRQVRPMLLKRLLGEEDSP